MILSSNAYRTNFMVNYFGECSVCSNSMSRHHSSICNVKTCFRISRLDLHEKFALSHLLNIGRSNLLILYSTCFQGLKQLLVPPLHL